MDVRQEADGYDYAADRTAAAGGVPDTSIWKSMGGQRYDVEGEGNNVIPDSRSPYVDMWVSTSLLRQFVYEERRG